MASVQTVGANCIVKMANRLTDEECKYGAKKQRKFRGGVCRGLYSITNGHGTFPGIRASNQSAAKACYVSCNTEKMTSCGVLQYQLRPLVVEKILTTAFHAFSSGLSHFFVRWCWLLWWVSQYLYESLYIQVYIPLSLRLPPSLCSIGLHPYLSH